MEAEVKDDKGPHMYEKGASSIACSRVGCTVTRDMPDDTGHSHALAEGWGIDNSNWLCPEHLAHRDAPNIEAAIRAAAEKAEADRLALEYQQKLMSEWREKQREGAMGVGSPVLGSVLDRDTDPDPETEEQ